MNDVLGCVFSPVDCATSLATNAADVILSLFPFGLYGLVFLAGMIVGERIGLWGIIIAIIGWITIRFGSKSINPIENIDPRSPDAAQATSRALTHDEVRRLQRGLNAKGFNPGPVDGKPGQRTREAIRQYQMSRGDQATGIPTLAQLKALGVWK